jgi:hypothetical protein
MQAQVQTDEQITQIAHLKFFKAEQQEQYKQKRKYIFHNPVAHIGCTSKCTYPVIFLQLSALRRDSYGKGHVELVGYWRKIRNAGKKLEEIKRMPKRL